MERAQKDIRVGFELRGEVRRHEVRPVGIWVGPGTIHDDKYAKTRGFTGGIVGGPALFADVCELVANFFGEAWTYRGELDLRFVAPVLSGEKVMPGGIVTERNDEESGTRVVLDVWLSKEDGSKCLTGTASCLILLR